MHLLKAKRQNQYDKEYTICKYANRDGLAQKSSIWYNIISSKQ